MLVIPTSLDTAIILGMDAGWMILEPAASVAAFILLVTYAYCCWEMFISLLGRDRPRRSRWTWLSAAGAMLVSAVALTSLMVGPVTFNAGQANWVSTSWGGVIGPYFLFVFEVCTLVLLVLRIRDATGVDPARRLTYSAWRLLALLVTLAYGLMLALNELQIYGSALGNTVLSLGFGLGVLGGGSLAALAAIQLMRRNAEQESLSRSV